jgi:hypothetical protein
MLPLISLYTADSTVFHFFLRLVTQHLRRAQKRISSSLYGQDEEAS